MNTANWIKQSKTKYMIQMVIIYVKFSHKENKYRNILLNILYVKINFLQYPPI